MEDVILADDLHFQGAAGIVPALVLEHGNWLGLRTTLIMKVVVSRLDRSIRRWRVTLDLVELVSKTTTLGRDFVALKESHIRKTDRTMKTSDRVLYCNANRFSDHCNVTRASDLRSPLVALPLEAFLVLLELLLHHQQRFPFVEALLLELFVFRRRDIAFIFQLPAQVLQLFFKLRLEIGAGLLDVPNAPPLFGQLRPQIGTAIQECMCCTQVDVLQEYQYVAQD